MVNYADCLLDSIETGILEYMKHNPTTTAVQVEIVDILDNVKGSYQVKYRDNLFVAHASNSGVYYKIGDKVYILVPDGNFDNPKIIIGKTAPSSDIIEQEDLSQGTYIHITDNLLTDTINQISLCSFSSLDTRTIEPLTNFKANLIRHFNDYKIYSLSCEIKTAFPMKQTARGNYGIKLQIPCYQLSASGEEEEITKEVILNSENLLGNPYSLIEWTKQEIYFQLNEITRINNFKDIKVYAYADNFLTSTDEPADIFIKNIEVAAVEVIPADKKEGFQLTLKGSPSNIFLQDVSDITLIPQLTLNGVITNIENYDCYWFVEDFSITSDHNLYSNISGAGWLCLNDRTELIENNNVNYIYDTKKYSHLIYETDIASALKYKCAVVINNNIISDTIEVKLVNPSIFIDLKTETGSTTFIKDMGNIPLICDVIGELHSNAVLEFKWIRNDKNNNFIEFLNTNKIALEDIENGKRAKISFPSSLVQDVNFIKVQVIENWIYNDNLYSRNLGSKQITINTSDNIKYSIRIENGNKLYKYDSDGDSPLVADYDGPVSSRITSILPLNYRLFKTQENGVEFSEEEYLNCKAVWKIPKNSMININITSSDNIVIDKESDEDFNLITINRGREDIAYTISSKYFPTKKDETVFLEVSFKNEKILTSTTINFIKEGENGTNGSKYTAIITYDGYEYEELDVNGNQRKLIILYQPQNDTFPEVNWDFKSYYKENWQSFNNIQPFNIKVYKDSEITTDETHIEWSIFDLESTQSIFKINQDNQIDFIEDKINEWKSNRDLDPCTIVQAKVTINSEVIYAYYPIEMIRIDSAVWREYFIPNFISGYSSVLYANDGTNPKYNNQSFKFEDFIDDSKDFLKYAWYSSDNFISYSNNNSNEYKAIPTEKYNNGNSKNYIKTTINMNKDLDETKLEDIVNQCEKQMNTLEELALPLRAAKEEYEEKGILLQYQKWIKDIDNYKNYINLRSILLQSLDTFYNEMQLIYSNLTFKEFINNNTFLLEIFNSFENVYYNPNKEILLGIEEDSFENFISKLEDDIQKTSIQTIYNFTNYMQKEDNVALFLRLEKLNTLNQEVILNYQNFKASQNQNYINFYNNFTNIQNTFKELIYESTYNNFLNDVTKILIKKFRTNFYSIQEIYTFFEDIKSICEPYYDLLEDRSEIKQYLYDKLNTELTILNNDIQENLVKYEKYNEILMAFSLPQEELIYIKPVIMLYNRYGMSNINDWDGNKLYIDENNNEYLLAPQVGAGVKNDNNQFTGIVMGVKDFNDPELGQEREVGLFGYHNGVQSIFLDAKTGKAEFGKSGASQIIIDPSNDKAIIQSGEYDTEKGKGMLIDFSTPEIRFGSGKFSVQSDGKVTMTGAEVSGMITAESGYIGKGENRWTITNKALTYGTEEEEYDSTKTTGIYIGTDGIRFGDKLYFTQNEFSVKTEIANIAGWTVEENKLHKDDKVGLGTFVVDGIEHNGFWAGGSQAENAIINPNFYADNNGDIYVKGTINTESGFIAGWMINPASIYRLEYENNSPKYNTFIGMGHYGNDSSNNKIGFWAGLEGQTDAYFRVTIGAGDETDGVLYAKGANLEGKITASSGQFGSGNGYWHINDNAITNSESETDATVGMGKWTEIITIKKEDQSETKVNHIVQGFWAGDDNSDSYFKAYYDTEDNKTQLKLKGEVDITQGKLGTIGVGFNGLQAGTLSLIAPSSDANGKLVLGVGEFFEIENEFHYENELELENGALNCYNYRNGKKDQYLALSGSGLILYDPANLGTAALTYEKLKALLELV